MKKIIKIDGYEFQGKYSDESDVQNLNIHLEKKFNDFYIKDFMSRRHPELFPGHIGLNSDDNFNLEVVIWEHGFLSPEGERENSWHCYKAKVLKTISVTFLNTIGNTTLIYLIS